MMLILVKSNLFYFITEISSSQVKLGLKGCAGNKGALAYRFEVLSSSFCFINCHLEPHKHGLKLRNESIQTISTSIKFLLPSTSVSIFEHDNIFWFGDLNYRLELPTDKITEKLSEGDIDFCLGFDQLKLARKDSNILNDFWEGKIEFLPTFKYFIGGDRFDLKREPAWCDRVLWKGLAEQIRYGSYDLITLSDHKPVFSYFRVTLKRKDLGKMSELRRKIYYEIDEKHSQMTPKAELSTETLEFGSIRYKFEYASSFTIKNTGQCSYLVEIKSDDWVVCRPNNFFIELEETVAINVSLLVDIEFYRANRYDVKKPGTFIKVKLSKYQILAVKIQYYVIDTFIGYSCYKLSKKMPSKHSNLPSPLIRIIEYLKSTSFGIRDLFESLRDDKHVYHIIKNIDENEEFNESVCPQQMIHTLFEFCSCLDSPIVKKELVDSIFDQLRESSINEIVNLILEKLKQANILVLTYICEYLKLYATVQRHNGITHMYLAEKISGPLFQTASIHPEYLLFLEQLIHNL